MQDTEISKAEWQLLREEIMRSPVQGCSMKSDAASLFSNLILRNQAREADSQAALLE